jgi:cell division septation protein DedD
MQALNRELEALKQASEDRRRRELASYAAALEDSSSLDVFAELKRSDDKLTIDPGLSRQVPVPSTRTKASGTATRGGPTTIPVLRRQEGLQAKAAGRLKLKIRPSADQRAPVTAPSAAGRAPQGQPGRLTVQVAAIKDARAAEQMVARLRREGFDAYQSKKTLPGQRTWYRVRVGRYPDRPSAAEVVRRLKGQGTTPIIVAY